MRRWETRKYKSWGYSRRSLSEYPAHLGELHSMPVALINEELIYALLKASLLYNQESEAGRIY